MTFTGINKENGIMLMQEYLLPYQKHIQKFPQGSVFRAVSCTSEYGYQDVLALMIDTPDGETYSFVRDPLHELSCPVPEPVCYEIDKALRRDHFDHGTEGKDPDDKLSLIIFFVCNLDFVPAFTQTFRLLFKMREMKHRSFQSVPAVKNYKFNGS